MVNLTGFSTNSAQTFTCNNCKYEFYFDPKSANSAVNDKTYEKVEQKVSSNEAGVIKESSPPEQNSSKYSNTIKNFEDLHKIDYTASKIQHTTPERKISNTTRILIGIIIALIVIIGFFALQYYQSKDKPVIQEPSLTNEQGSSPTSTDTHVKSTKETEKINKQKESNGVSPSESTQSISKIDDELIAIPSKGLAICKVNKAYFYNDPDNTTRRKSYIVEGQNIKYDSIKGEFIFCYFTNDKGIETKGWMLKSNFGSFKNSE